MSRMSATMSWLIRDFFFCGPISARVCLAGFPGIQPRVIGDEFADFDYRVIRPDTLLLS